MSNRRDFLKTSLVITASVVVGNTSSVLAKPLSFPKGIVYTTENPGKWSKMVKGHTPKVKVEGNHATIKTDHVMTEEHYIVRHTLVSPNGKVLGEKTFYPSDEEAISVFELPADHSSILYATSFCNKHDLWVAEFNV